MISSIKQSCKRSPDCMQKEESLVLVIDVQERLVPAMAQPAHTLANIRLLTQGAIALQVPVMVTEQYPKGLGPTDSRAVAMEGAQLLPEKNTFSVIDGGAIEQALRNSGATRIIVCGIEAHICVLQSVLDLLANFEGWVYVVQDAVDSRNPENKKLALNRMQQAGAHIVCTEMVLFEWMQNTACPQFKAVSAMVKNHKPLQE